MRHQCSVALALPVFPVGASPLRDDVRHDTQLAAAYAAFERGLPSGGAGGQGLVVELELPEALALVRAHGVCIYFVKLHVYRHSPCLAFARIISCSCQGCVLCPLPRVCCAVQCLRTWQIPERFELMLQTTAGITVPAASCVSEWQRHASNGALVFSRLDSSSETVVLRAGCIVFTRWASCVHPKA